MAKNGEKIVLESRASGSFKLVPVNDEDTIIDKQDLMAEVKGALREAKEYLEGKRELKSLDELINEIRD